MSSWKYIDNQFDHETKRSYRKAYIISCYHYDRMPAQIVIYPALQGLFDRYAPLHLHYVAEYGKWKLQTGAQTTATATVGELFATGKTKLSNVWVVTIQTVYVKTSKEYKAIFPNGVKPFNTGSVDLRILAYETLAQSISKEPKLAALCKEIQDFHAQLVNARKGQGGAIGTTQVSSSGVEKARVAAMEMQYRNLGAIMDNYYEERDLLLPLVFDLQTLREQSQTVYNATLEAHKTKAVLEHTFMDDDKMTVHNKGNGPVKLYLSTSATAQDSTAVEV